MKTANKWPAELEAIMPELKNCKNPAVAHEKILNRLKQELKEILGKYLDKEIVDEEELDLNLGEIFFRIDNHYTLVRERYIWDAENLEQLLANEFYCELTDDYGSYDPEYCLKSMVSFCPRKYRNCLMKS